MAKAKFNSIAEAGGTHYDTLGVLASASDDEIRKAFFKIARRSHDDIVIASGVRDKNTITSHAQLIREANTAYSVLRDPKQRRAYDRAQVFTAPKCRTCKGTGKVEKLKGFKVTMVTCSACGGTGK